LKKKTPHVIKEVTFEQNKNNYNIFFAKECLPITPTIGSQCPHMCSFSNVNSNPNNLHLVLLINTHYIPGRTLDLQFKIIRKEKSQIDESFITHLWSPKQCSLNFFWFRVFYKCQKLCDTLLMILLNNINVSS